MSSSRGRFGRDHHGVARRLSRRVVEHRRAVELHGQAIALAQPVALVAERDVDRAFEHPHLLVHAHVARAVLERHARAGRELAPRRSASAAARPAARRCAGGSPRPGRATAAGRRAARPGRSARLAPRRPARRTARPASRRGPRRASRAPPRSGCSRRARSSEIIERLTPLLLASASSERPRAARSSRTRSAMRWFRSDAVLP